LAVRLKPERADIIQEAAVRRSLLPPRLEIGFRMAEAILTSLSYDEFATLSTEWFTDEVRDVGQEYLAPSEWTWLDSEEAREELRQDAIDDVRRWSRARAVLHFARSGPGVQFRNNLEGGTESFEFRLDSRRTGSKQLRAYVERQRDLTRRLLALIYRKRINNDPIDLIPTLDALGLESVSDIEAFEQSLVFLSRMGFIRSNGGLLPMAIETYLESKAPIETRDTKSEDYRVYERFQQAERLKELRLRALQVLASLDDKRDQNDFISEYLDSRSAEKVFSLLEKTLDETGADPDLLRSLRKEALKNKVRRLTEEQQDVYEEPLDESIVVSAGPGSGKTHTLLLRLARLIHEENVSPRRILVLAYNRAVVAEIKTRLRHLFRDLGYSDMARRLRVHTFHSLIRRVLGDEVDPDDLQTDGETWVETFNRFVHEQPGRIGMHLSPETIRYIFVDEFQDITGPRYRMLQWIAGTSSTVTVIGDPDQSIYGYERANNGRPWSAQPVFDGHAEFFDASTYHITDNFRSLPKIVEHAETFIQRNQNRDPRPSLQPKRSCPEEWELSNRYVEVEEQARHAWVKRLKTLVQEKGPEGAPPRDVAVLFRTNAEVGRAYRLVQEYLGSFLRRERIPLVIQGANRNWPKIREVAFCLDQLENVIEQDGEEASFSCDAPVWKETIRPEGGFADTWDSHTLRLVQGLIQRFQEEQTDAFLVHDLISQLKNTLRPSNDQVYKLLQLQRDDGEKKTHTPSIVLSTLHKVKGMEYDTVVMPASLADLPAFANEDYDDIEDQIEEERRVYYVGMTRARNRLLRFEWDRERHLQAGKPFQLKEEYRSRMGVALDADAFAGHVKISKCANERFLRQQGGFRNGEDYLQYMRNEVQPGDALICVRDNRRWYVCHNGTRIAEMARGSKEKLQRHFGGREDMEATGLAVTDVVRYTYEDSKAYDEERDSNYTEQWSDVFKRKGYTYLVNFAGFARRSTHITR
jgi:ATP-dependent DNA helicase RecQ